MGTLNFCKKCNNILYPREDKEPSNPPSLRWACRICTYSENVDSGWVYKVELNQPTAEKADANPTTDPTLPRTKNVKCANCNYGEAVFYEAPAKGEQGLALYFACCRPQCGHRWRD